MKYKIQKERLILIALIICGAIIMFFGYNNYQLLKNILFLEKEFVKTEDNFVLVIKKLRSDIDLLRENLGEAEKERYDFERKYNNEKTKMDLFDSQISGIQGTVGLLEKLSKTDPELLNKYSKIYFLNENYIPETLVKINPKYTYEPQEDYFFYSKTWPFLENLMSFAISEGIDIKIISAYRSFNIQAELKSGYQVVYGSGANQFSADQGYSEHQLGTTIDFTTSKIRASFSGFENTETYQWLLDNAYKYGFILSYPENNKYYQFEPWHWRFVGKNLAERLREENKNFYDLDQREINSYLISFFD